MRLTLLIATLLSACTTSQPLRTTVHLRDVATHAPIANASVSSVALDLYMPTWHTTLWLAPGATVGPPANPGAARTLTNAQGIATITLAGSRPNQVVISVNGYHSIQLVVETSTNSINRPVAWITGEQPPPVAPATTTRAMEARFVADNPTP